MCYPQQPHSEQLQSQISFGRVTSRIQAQNVTTMLACSWKPLYGTGNKNNAVNGNKILSHFANCSITNTCIRCTVPTEISYSQWPSRTQLQCHMTSGGHNISLQNSIVLCVDCSLKYPIHYVLSCNPWVKAFPKLFFFPVTDLYTN